MGEITAVDVAQLRVVADRVRGAAEHIAQMRWPELDPAELGGSAVARATAPAAMAGRLTDVAADMRDWALAARTSAEAFERAERANGDRFGR